MELHLRVRRRAGCSCLSQCSVGSGKHVSRPLVGSSVEDPSHHVGPRLRHLDEEREALVARQICASAHPRVEASAQRDVLRVLEHEVQKLYPQSRVLRNQAVGLEETAHNELASVSESRLEGGLNPGVHALLSVQWHLARLRHMFVSMEQRCEDLSQDLCDDGSLLYEGSGRHLGHLEPVSIRSADFRGGDLRRLQEELSVSTARYSEVLGEEQRLSVAARKDQAEVAQLRAQIAANEVRNADLQVPRGSAHTRRGCAG